MKGSAASGHLAPTAPAPRAGTPSPAGLPIWRPGEASAWRRDLRTCLLILAGLLAWDASGLDLAVVRWYGDAGGFAWREHWFTRDLLHTGGRWLAALALTALVLNLRWPLPGSAGPNERRTRWMGLLLTLACLLTVPTLKQFSLSSCPWSLAEFGGVARYVSHWQFGVADGGSGHCFPSGHATSAFAFLGGYVMLRDRHPVAASRWLLGVLGVGCLFGWAQMARGAHYPSHTGWSAWFCWVICCAGQALWQRPATGYDPARGDQGLTPLPHLPPHPIPCPTELPAAPAVDSRPPCGGSWQGSSAVIAWPASGPDG